MEGRNRTSPAPVNEVCGEELDVREGDTGCLRSLHKGFSRTAKTEKGSQRRRERRRMGVNFGDGGGEIGEDQKSKVRRRRL